MNRDEYVDRLETLFPALMNGMSNILPDDPQMDLNWHQMSVLGFLMNQENHSATMGEVANAMAPLSQSTMTKIATSLKALQLIDRDVPEENRRTVIISLTKKGKKIATDVRKFRRRRRQLLYDMLSEKQRTNFLDALETMVKKLASGVKPNGK